MYNIMYVNYPFRYALHTINIQTKCKDIIQFIMPLYVCSQNAPPADQLSYGEEESIRQIHLQGN